MLVSFVTGFTVARVFTTLNPEVTVIAGGIHFHHFWYGLTIMVVASLFAILHDKPRYRRFYAISFGFGSGLVGDEIGLLLTFGNYGSNLTSFFFVIVVSAGLMGLLFFRYKNRIEYDVLSMKNSERTVYTGVVVAGLSALNFGDDYIVSGVVTVAAGLLITAAGLWWHRREGLASASAQS